MLTFKQENVTPEKAQQWLEATRAQGFVNRKTSQANIDRYARDMAGGKWRNDTGEVIKFDTTGSVIDGQNRLEAVIQSEATIPLWVCRGLDREVFQYLDQGKPRDLQNLMEIEEYPQPRILAVTGKMLWRFDKTQEIDGEGNPYAHAGRFNESEGAILEWIKGHQPSLVSTWESYGVLIKKAHRGTNGNLGESLLFFCLYQWMIEDAEMAYHVFDFWANRADGVAARHPAMSWAAEYANDLKVAKQTNGTGATSGRHGDAKECLWKVVTEMWRIIRDPADSKAWSGRKYQSFKRHCVNELGAYRI